MNDTTNDRSRAWSPATIAVRLSGLWLLAGALAKLFLGTPKDLPELVRKLSPFSLDLTFHLVIVVELAIVWLAMLKPRWAWPLITALFVFFEFVLGSQLSAGAESCGCFGATIKVSPYLMVAIDGVLLSALLLTRPWKTIDASGVRLPIVAAVIAVSAAIPWLVIPPQTDLAKVHYIDMSPGAWVGKSVFEITELSNWVSADKLPTDGKVVLWRQGCTHCAAHLRKMAKDDDGSQPIVLLQIRDDLKDSRAVDAMPNGPHVTMLEMPENREVSVTTPWEIRIEGGVVKEALDQEHAEALDK